MLSVHLDNDDATAFVGGGLSGDDAVGAIRFIRERASSEPALESVTGISCVAAASDREIYVEYGATVHHAGSASGLLVLERKGDAFEVESAQPPPNWFEGAWMSDYECDETRRFSLPEC